MVKINLGFSRDKSIAVIDVSPGGASVAIISSPKSGPAKILSAAASTLSLEARSAEQARSLIGSQIEEAAARASKLYTAGGHTAPVTSAYVIIHAPWVESCLVRASEHFEREVRLEDSHVSSIAKNALVNAKDVDLSRLMSATAIRILVNGYPTPDPAGLKARSLDVTSLVCMCEPEVRSAIEGAVHRAFPAGEISLRSALRSYLTVAQEAGLGGDLLIIDMGSDDTHVASVREGTLEQQTVPEGIRTILNRIASGRLPDEVLGYMRMIERDACASEACDAVKQSLALAEPELVRIFGEAISKIATIRRAPNGLLLSAHPDIEDWLATFFARIDFAQFTVTSLPLSVCTPGSLNLAQWVEDARATDPIELGAALVNIELRNE